MHQAEFICRSLSAGKQVIIFEDGDRNTMEWGGMVHILVEVTWRAGTLKLVSSMEPGRMLYASCAVMSSLNK